MTEFKGPQTADWWADEVGLFLRGLDRQMYPVVFEVARKHIPEKDPLTMYLAPYAEKDAVITSNMLKRRVGQP